jgi:hypothetical protein
MEYGLGKKIPYFLLLTSYFLVSGKELLIFLAIGQQWQLELICDY